MSDSIIIRRQPANTMLPARGQVCGAAEVDITPNLGFTMAEYSIEAKKAAGLRRRAVDPRVTVLVAVAQDGTCLYFTTEAE
jgi:hypothetical protein